MVFVFFFFFNVVPLVGFLFFCFFFWGGGSSFFYVLSFRFGGFCFVVHWFRQFDSLFLVVLLFCFAF